MDHQVDFAVIGGGIAGQGIAAGLAARGGRVAVLDQYPMIPYGSTGRSAALYAETYFSSPPFCALTVASRSFFEAPPPGFSEVPLVTEMGALYVAGRRDAAELARFWAAVQGSRAHAILLENRAEIRELAPLLRPRYPLFAVHEPEAKRMDVDAIHGGFRRQMLRHGGLVLPGAELCEAYWQGCCSTWLLVTTEGLRIGARVVVDASGAWGDLTGAILGATSIGLRSLRRTAFVSRIDGTSPGFDHMPFVFAAAGDLYFRPEAGRILVSPSDETPTVPRDEQPEAIDIARATALFHEMTTARLAPRPDRAWAGIRPFAPDKKPVVGFDPAAPNVFRLLGHGGYGIQTSPALSRLAVSLMCGEGVPADLQALGIVESDLSPARFAAVRLAAE